MPNKLKDPVRHKFTKKHYNKRDWTAYNKSLVNRGSITIWFTEDALKQWENQGVNQRKRGAQRKFSDYAIEACHMMRLVYKKPLRQTEGFVNSLLELMGSKLKSPDYTTLSRRLQKIKINQKPIDSGENIVIIFDSTGLKVTGEKEWMNAKHGTKQRKIWRKLSIAINQNGDIISHTLSEHTFSDPASIGPLLDQIETPVSKVLGDGGYDSPQVYTQIDKHNKKYGYEGDVDIIIPPNTGFSAIRDTDHQSRKQNQKMIDDIGREGWQKKTGYGMRSNVEAAFARFKKVIGNKINSKNTEAQINEIGIAILALNKMNSFSAPKAQKSC